MGEKKKRVLIQFFILILVLLSLVQISADTQTQLNISNSPPGLIQNIPDILIIMDTPKIDAFDLNDYFEDANGDIMIFDYTTISNIITTINSENQVSFYPDIGYSGSQFMQFNASDATSTSTSNFFQITVGLDTIPPQWSSPKKSLASIYQNYHVTFTTKWTDNVELKDFIFSINQGLGWQNQTVTPFTGTANTSSFKIQISAPAGTNVSWTFYASDIYNNTNKVDIQNFTVKAFNFELREEYDGETEYEGDSETTASESGGVSYGTGGAEMDYFKEGILAKNLEVDVRSLKVTLKQGTSVTKVVQIINTGNTNVKLNASIKYLERFTKLGDTDIEIAPGETHELLIEFTAPYDAMPDQYFGFLLLNYGDQISIPIVLDIKKFESDVRIKVNLTKDSKAVRVGEKVTALITIKNLQDTKNSSSQLYYAIKNFKGDIIESASEDIILETIFQEERMLTVPEGTFDGEYIFYARIISEDAMDLDSEKFLIGARFKIIAILRKFFYPTIILILLIILLLLYLVYKQNKKKKRLLELYLLLNELRGLVKEGKTMEAMDIYKRIKLTYGQHISKGFMEDEVKLREELNKFSKILTETEPKPEPKSEPKSEPSKSTPNPTTPKPNPKEPAK